MTVSLDARTPSASVHALSGSTPPGAARLLQGFSIDPEVSSAAGPLHLGGIMPDAEVIDLAGRVKALAVRDHRIWDRRAAIDDAVDAAMPARPIPPEALVRGTIQKAETDGMQVTTFSVPTTPDPTYVAALTAYESAAAQRARLEGEMEAQLGYPRLEKLSKRTFARLVRWTERLMSMQPQTQAGLKAKAEVQGVLAETGNAGDWVTDFASSVGRDALRIIGAEADARAEQDRQADGELFHYGRRWEAADLEHCTAEAAMEASWHSFIASAPAIPEEMFVSDEDHHRVGPYVRPHGVDGRMWYGDPDTLTMLREGYPKDISAERRAEILAANDRWVSANDAARRGARCDVLEAAERASAARENTARRALLLTPAHTLDGLLLKARAAMSPWCGSEFGLVGLERKLRAAITGDATDEAAMAVLVDLARMVSAEPAAIPAIGAASNLRPVPLPADLSALRLGAEAAGDVREWYRSWLYAELRLLNLELDGSTDKLAIRQDNPGAAFHYPAEASWTDVPKPSTRAAAVLGLLGILPRHDGAGDLARVA